MKNLNLKNPKIPFSWFSGGFLGFFVRVFIANPKIGSKS
jgi:hypothetical protein